MKYIGESGWILLFEEGLNKVAVGVYFSEIYEEAEIYKRVGELLTKEVSKIYLAILPEATLFIDPRYFKNQGVGVVVVDPSRGLEGVEIKIFAKPRLTATTVADTNKFEILKSTMLEYINSQLKKLEETLYEKLKRYIDQRIEEVRRQTGGQPPRETQVTPGSVVENEWVRILRSRGKSGS